MTGLSPTAVIVGIPAGVKSLISVVFARQAWPSRVSVTSLEDPGEYAKTVPASDTATTPSLRSFAIASSRTSDMEAGSLASPTHSRPSLGSRTANTDPPWTWTAFSGSVIAWPSEKDVERTGVTVRPTVSPSVTSPPACPMSKDADLTETVPSSMSAS